MAVPDWPNTYGSNMFLYPLAKMTGGVFYEHAHRLLGSLVGLTTLTLAVLLSIDRRSIAALVFVWIVGLCVLLQGVMGGLRVTDNSTHLAVVHGFFAHVILAGAVGVAVLLTPRYSSRRPSLCDGARVIKDITAERDEYRGNAASPNETDAFLATLLVLAILGQTLLGTLVRQMDVGLMVHLSVAMLVAVLGDPGGRALVGPLSAYHRPCPRGRGVDGRGHLATHPGRDLAGVSHAAGRGFAFRTAVAGPARCPAPPGPCHPDDSPSDDGRRALGSRHAAGLLGLALGSDAGRIGSR